MAAACPDGQNVPSLMLPRMGEETVILRIFSDVIVIAIVDIELCQLAMNLILRVGSLLTSA